MQKAEQAKRRFLIDISTSLRWRGHSAVGIVRTERELAQYFLRHRPDAAFFSFDIEKNEFWLVPVEEVAALFEGRVPAPKHAVESSLGERVLLRFRQTDVVVSVGLQWDLSYMAQLYTEKLRCGMTVVQMVHDIIPIKMAEYCVPGMEFKFPKFLLDTGWTADLIVSNSESTSRDLTAYFDDIGLKTPPIVPIRLGSDLPTDRPLTDPSLFELKPSKFVLYVSTIEPRKNHQMLFNIWRELHARDKDNLPTLVFVGGMGWNSDNFTYFVKSSHSLYPKYVKVLSDITDEQLDWLYRNAQFTLYPSLYEGWGIPIAESLARGKVCISSNTSSMPEVGERFADLIHPMDYIAWRDRIAHYLSEPDALAAREKDIADGYTITTWDACMSRFSQDLFAALDR